MDELLAWLRPQNTGLRTYKDFQQKVMQLGASDRNHLALYHILAMLAARFVETYEENPLPADVAGQAFNRLIAAVEKAARARKGSPSEQLTALNEIAATDLA